MILITRASRLISLTERLRGYIQAHPAFAYYYDPMIEELEALDSIGTDDVVRIMGSDSWVDTICTFCHEDRGMVVKLGEIEDGEGAMINVDICPDCLQEAHYLIPIGVV